MLLNDESIIAKRRQRWIMLNEITYLVIWNKISIIRTSKILSVAVFYQTHPGHKVLLLLFQIFFFECAIAIGDQFFSSTVVFKLLFGFGSSEKRSLPIVINIEQTVAVLTSTAAPRCIVFFSLSSRWSPLQILTSTHYNISIDWHFDFYHYIDGTGFCNDVISGYEEDFDVSRSRSRMKCDEVRPSMWMINCICVCDAIKLKKKKQEKELQKVRSVFHRCEFSF